MNRSLNGRQHWTVARLVYWYLDRGRWEQAETLARGLLTLDNSDGLAWKYYGEARRKQGDYEGAARAFSEAASRRPEDGQVWMRLGDCMLRRGRRDEARRALQKAQKVVDAGLRRRVEALLVACGA